MPGPLRHDDHLQWTKSPFVLGAIDPKCHRGLTFDHHDHLVTDAMVFPFAGSCVMGNKNAPIPVAGNLGGPPIMTIPSGGSVSEKLQLVERS